MKILSIIIPMYNEERTLQTIIQKVVSVDISNLGYTKEIILVNDGSTDQTEKSIRNLIKKDSTHSLKYITYNTNKGKGYAIKQGIKKCNGDFILIQDADLEYDPQDYKILLTKQQKEKLDIVYGSRFLGQKKYQNKSYNRWYAYGNKLLSIIASILLKYKITDIYTCYKLIDAKHKKDLLRPDENGFDWEIAISTILFKKKSPYGEVAIHYYPRSRNEGKKIKGRHWFLALKAILRWKYIK